MFTALERSLLNHQTTGAVDTCSQRSTPRDPYTRIECTLKVKVWNKLLSPEVAFARHFVANTKQVK